MSTMNNHKFYENLSEKDIKAIGGLAAADEVFKEVPEVKGWFISNYGRLISKRKNGTARIVKTYFTNGYEHVVTYTEKGKNRTAKLYAIHQLVAQAFVEVPAWIKPHDIIEVHHIRRVNRKNRVSGINCASNLSYLPKSLHKTVDVIAEIAVFEEGFYRQYDFVSAAERLHIDPYCLADIIRQEPTKRKGKCAYYQCTVNADGVAVDVNFRIIRTKDI